MKPIKNIMIFIIVCTVCPEPMAWANMSHGIGLGSKATARGNAFTAPADDFSAVYYNPAGLSFQDYPDKESMKGWKMELGYLYAHPDLWIKDQGAEKEESDVGNSTFTNYGFTYVRGRIGLGLGLFSCRGRTYGWMGDIKAMTRYFVRYYKRNDRLGVLPALSVRIFQWLSVGGGFRFLQSIETDTWIDLELKTGDISHREHSKTTLKTAPLAGLMFNFKELFKFGLVYRGGFHMDDYGVITFRIPELEEAIGAIKVHFNSPKFYMPDEIAAGLSLDFPDIMEVAVDLSWLEWSGFDERGGDQSKPDTVFRDVWIPRVGLEVPLKNHRFRAGYYYYRSPVESISRNANQVDNDKHVISTGYAWTLDDPPGFWDKPMTLNWHIQYHHLKERYFAKESELYEYYPGYRSGGSQWDTGVTLSVPW